ncbi:unnamed protein product [Calicophoron daubneyi]|uniref:Uncharacterized protein n=1 Tax=Calicophoron daubneyi TaxID=300641 RepID=A0AAV2T0P0_CALDB
MFQIMTMTPANNTPMHYPVIPASEDLNKYGHLLQVIEEMGRDIKPTYANNKNAAERLKKNIHTARILSAVEGMDQADLQESDMSELSTHPPVKQGSLNTAISGTVTQKMEVKLLGLKVLELEKRI